MAQCWNSIVKPAVSVGDKTISRQHRRRTRQGDASMVFMFESVNYGEKDGKD
jgi:hypothetical protein